MKVLSRLMFMFFLCAAAMSGQNQSSAPGNFSLQKTTEVPGSQLRAGTYNLTVLDSLADRMVMRVNSADGKAQTLILGVRSSLSGAPGQPVFWDAKEQGRHALRGFVFSDGKGVEFVYPKADAVALAKANHSSVVAVDPASEGRPELGRLSSNDMQMVNLWLLTPTRVSGQDGLEAKHYEPSGTSATSAAVTAQASAPSASGVPVPSSENSASVSRTSAQGTRVASAPRQASKPAPPSRTLRASAADVPQGIKRLPQTGSPLPLWFLLTAASLSGAAALRIRRAAQASA